MNLFDPAQMSAADALRLIAHQFAANPFAVVEPIVGWVLVPALVLSAAVWAVLALIGRHPEAALPPVASESEAAETVDLSSFAAQILAGRVPIERTAEIRAGRR